MNAITSYGAWYAADTLTVLAYLSMVAIYTVAAVLTVLFVIHLMSGNPAPYAAIDWCARMDAMDADADTRTWIDVSASVLACTLARLSDPLTSSTADRMQSDVDAINASIDAYAARETAYMVSVYRDRVNDAHAIVWSRDVPDPEVILATLRSEAQNELAEYTDARIAYMRATDKDRFRQARIDARKATTARKIARMQAMPSSAPLLA